MKKRSIFLLSLLFCLWLLAGGVIILNSDAGKYVIGKFLEWFAPAPTPTIMSPRSLNMMDYIEEGDAMRDDEPLLRPGQLDHHVWRVVEGPAQTQPQTQSKTQSQDK